jgi:putative transposase
MTRATLPDAGSSRRIWMRASGTTGSPCCEQEELRRLRRENRILREARAIVRTAAACCARETDAIRCAATRASRVSRPLSPFVACATSSVSPRVGTGRGGGARRQLAPAPPAQVTTHSVRIQQASRGTDGALRVQAERAAPGVPCGHHRVARLMRQARWLGCPRRRPVQTTRRDRAALPAPDRVPRAGTALRPDPLGVADST